MSVYIDDFKLVGAKVQIAPMWKQGMKSIDLEPLLPLQGNVYIGCKQDPESIDKSVVQQNSQNFSGFFMGKNDQDAAHALRKQLPESNHKGTDDNAPRKCRPTSSWS